MKITSVNNANQLTVEADCSTNELEKKVNGASQACLECTVEKGVSCAKDSDKNIVCLALKNENKFLESVVVALSMQKDSSKREFIEVLLKEGKPVEAQEIAFSLVKEESKKEVARAFVFAGYTSYAEEIVKSIGY